MQINIINGTLTSIQETLSPVSGYSLPASITVTGVSSSYNSSTGLVDLTNCTSSMSLEANGALTASSSAPKRIKKMKIAGDNYDIVPEKLQNSGYIASLPTLTADATIALTSDIPSGGGASLNALISRNESLPTANASSPDFVTVGEQFYVKKYTVTSLENTVWQFNAIPSPYGDSSVSNISPNFSFNCTLDYDDTVIFTGIITPAVDDSQCVATVLFMNESPFLYIAYLKTTDTFYNTLQLDSGNGWYAITIENNNPVSTKLNEPPIITITTGTDTENTEALDWFKQNAQPITVTYEYVYGEAGGGGASSEILGDIDALLVDLDTGNGV